MGRVGSGSRLSDPWITLYEADQNSSARIIFPDIGFIITPTEKAKTTNVLVAIARVCVRMCTPVMHVSCRIGMLDRTAVALHQRIHAPR
jgi:hypothetical protein